MRVAHFSLLLGKELNLSEEELYQLEVASLFHDIGKVGTPDAILTKPTRLEEDEFVIMKEHPSLSGEILSSFTEFTDAAKFATHHHERFDGRGYPDNLKGDEIPLMSRIILIADTFDAMTSTRHIVRGFPTKLHLTNLLSSPDHSLIQTSLSTLFQRLKRRMKQTNSIFQSCKKVFKKSSIIDFSVQTKSTCQLQKLVSVLVLILCNWITLQSF